MPRTHGKLLVRMREVGPGPRPSLSAQSVSMRAMAAWKRLASGWWMKARGVAHEVASPPSQGRYPSSRRSTHSKRAPGQSQTWRAMRRAARSEGRHT